MFRTRHERERLGKSMNTQTKIALGSVLATLGALAIVLPFLRELTAASSSWDFLSGFIVGVITGFGATLVIAGLIERRRAKIVKKGP